MEGVQHGSHHHKQVMLSGSKETCEGKELSVPVREYSDPTSPRLRAGHFCLVPRRDRVPHPGWV